ncbi:MAG TPA: helix-turn-helix transcriptional regulator [Chryseosolibacter sp.]|nr:helix-turn-helix transcriptional regulator [Chryseosolibacter sp.]
MVSFNRSDDKLQKKIRDKINEIAAMASDMPGVIILHGLPNFNLLYMSPLGLKMLGQKWEDIQGMSNEEYHKRFFNEEHAQYYVPKILDMITRNHDEVVSYFQQVRTSVDREWDWYMSMTKILLRDDARIPIVAITIAMKIDPDHYFTAKAARLLEENIFLRKNFDRFASLTKREKEILKLLAVGKSAAEVAKQLHISVTTAETHRKNIKQKLKASNSYDLARYAHAFDLI